MKRTFRGVSLAAALLLLLVSSLTAFAEDRQGASGWEVSFNGKRMDSNFTSASIVNDVNDLLPGDSVELTINLKNDFDGKADWYMKNEVLDALEDAGNAAGGAYDYLLTYTDAAGETTTLYSSEKFGGDGRINGVGLHGATNTLEDYFYLDRMEGSASGTVKLKVALDGETLVNNYQNTFARLQMDFATELVESDSQTPGNPGTPGRTIKTGDEARITLYLALMFAAGTGLLVVGLLMRRRQQREEEQTEMVRRR